MSREGKRPGTPGAVMGWGVVVLFASAAVGCTAELGSVYTEGDAELGQKANPFVNELEFPTGHSCTTSQRLLIWAAAQIAYDNLTSPDMKRCLVSHGLSSTNDRSPEYILNDLRENMPTKFLCRELGTNVSAASGIDTADETINFDNEYLSSPWTELDDVAAVLLHELAHAKGYEHGVLTVGGLEYSYTPSEQIEKCSLSISSGDYHADAGLGNVPRGRGEGVGYLDRASQLGQVGRLAGTPKDDVCSEGKYVSGISGYYDNEGIAGLAFKCRRPDGSGTYTTSLRGRAEGTAFSQSCPTGELMLGIHGMSDWKLRSLGGFCRPADDIESGSYEYLSIDGKSVGDTYLRPCPLGQAVKGIRSYATSAGVQGYTLSCEDLGSATEQAVSSLDMAGESSGQQYLDRCPRHAVMNGLFGRSGSEVNQLGGVCTQVWSSGDYVRRTGPAMILPGRGSVSAGEDWPGEECPAGQALVGLDLRSGARVDRVRGICADVEKWSNGSSSPTQTRLSWHGGTGGTQETYLCERDYFLSGWQIWVDEHNDSKRVFGIKPRCIKPES